MSGQALYRKWRPPRFADIVGQGPITQTLTHAVASDRASHAYLLCGPRGTGKTSTARVLAKSLNCADRPAGVGDPCGLCDNCRAIENGSFVDLIEIDAASNRGIDEMRDLREKVRFAPTVGRNKVYIIDEAHALTNDAFNAFLKTLEEPPPNTVFVLATTEPHRLPATIISRCQRFDFHRIALSDIVERLESIARDEGVDASTEALRLVARAAGGSLRDATNLLDQLITSFGEQLTDEQVREMLGAGGEEQALDLVKRLLAGNTSEALEVINSVAREGVDLRPLHRATVDYLRAVLLIKSGVTDALDISADAQSQLSDAAAGADIEQIMRALRLFGQASLRFDQPSPLPLELAAVELALAPPPPAPPQAAAAPAPARSAPQRSAPPPRPPAAVQQRPPQYPPPSGRPDPPPAPAYDPGAPLQQRLDAQWSAILKSLNNVPRTKFDVAALLRSSTTRRVDGDTLVVVFSHQSNSERLQSELDNPRCKLEVENALKQALGDSLTVRVESDAGGLVPNGPKQGSHMVQFAQSIGGQVVSESDAGYPPSDEAPEAASGPPRLRRKRNDAMNRNMIKQAQQLQARLAKAQEDLEAERIEASSGGGAVKVVATGKQTIESIVIDPSAVDPEDVEILQDMVLAAVNEALAKSQELASARLGAITGGLKIPGM